MLLKSQLAQIGVELNIKTIPGDNQFTTIYHDGSYQALLYLSRRVASRSLLNLYNSSTAT